MNKLFYIQTCCNRIACLMFIDKLDILTFQKKIIKNNFLENNKLYSQIEQKNLKC